MRDEEKIMRIKTLADCDRELGRDGDEESREANMARSSYEKGREELMPGSSEQRNTDFPLTVRDAAIYLGVSPQTVYLWVERRQIPHLRVMGRNIRFLRSDLSAFRATFKQEVVNGTTEEA